MAGGKSNYLNKKLLDHSNAVASFTMPTGCWLGLCTTAGGSPSASANGTELTNGTAPGYTRTQCVFGAATGATTGTASNSVNFMTATPSADWPEVAYWVLWDAATSGNPLRWGAFAAAFTAKNTVPVMIPAGALVDTEA